MQALFERHRGERIAHLRRRAESDRVDRRTFGEQRLQRPEVDDALDARIPRADAGDELEFGVARDRREMLVACDLAHADNGDADTRHAQSAFTETDRGAALVSVLRSGSVKGAASISNTSPSRVVTPSANDSVAVPKKWTWMSPGRRNRSYLK